MRPAMDQREGTSTSRPQMDRYLYFPKPPHPSTACAFSLGPWVAVEFEDRSLPQGGVERQVSWGCSLLSQ